MVWICDGWSNPLDLVSPGRLPTTGLPRAELKIGESKSESCRTGESQIRQRQGSNRFHLLTFSAAVTAPEFGAFENTPTINGAPPARLLRIVLSFPIHGPSDGLTLLE